MEHNPDDRWAEDWRKIKEGTKDLKETIDDVKSIWTDIFGQSVLISSSDHHKPTDQELRARVGAAGVFRKKLRWYLGVELYHNGREYWSLQSGPFLTLHSYDQGIDPSDFVDLNQYGCADQAGFIRVLFGPDWVSDQGMVIRLWDMPNLGQGNDHTEINPKR